MEYVFTHIKYTSQQMTHLHTKKYFLTIEYCATKLIFLSLETIVNKNQREKKKKLDGKFLDLLVVCDASDGMRNDLK